MRHAYAFKIVGTALLAISLAACSGKATPHREAASPTTSNPVPSSERPATEKPVSDTVKEIPFDYAALQDSVLIQLDEEPRLRSPIMTVVTPEPQEYTLFFREKMNRPSVEQTLTRRAEERTRKDERSVVPAFTFAWASDQQLHLTVTLPANAEPYFATGSYLLDVSGAKTATGKELKEAPTFIAVVYSPPQLWRLSVDGKQKERIYSFEQPYYSMEFLGDDSRYLLLSRFQQYCECDAEHERLYAIFDQQKKRLIPYPVALTTHYMGEGEFVADRRGFFYKQPASGMTMPESETTVNIRLNEYVHGAIISKDRSHLVMALGMEGQEGDYDLVIRHLDTGKEQRISGALKGMAPHSELNGNKMPVTFFDDGKDLYFFMRHKAEFKELRYRYSWSTQKVSAWNPPIPEDTWSGFSASSDGMYQLYANGGLFRGTEHIADPPYSDVWLNGTHRFVYHDYDQQAPDSSRYKEQIKLYDADHGTTQTVATNLFINTAILGTSPDGKWIYVQSHADLDREGR
jgi:hypothetical protein